jgi:competence protein ComEA
MDALRAAVRELTDRAGFSGRARGPVLVVALLAILGAAAIGLRNCAPTGTVVTERRADAGHAVPGATAPAPSIDASVSQAEERIVVHVVGAVGRPGVYRLSGDARVGDVIEAAGGLLGSAEPRAVNMARMAQDGEQILVPTQDEYASGSTFEAPGGGPGTDVSGQLVDLNRADETALEALPGIGPKTAARIVADREANGPFGAVEDLMRVSGIGEKKLEALADLVTVR